MPLYFAYGSNMDRNAMASRCPASRAVGTARLPRHRFFISGDGYASVRRDPRAEVWGLLWDLALADVPSLDRYENVSGRLYAKITQTVLTPAGPRRALLYVGRSGEPGQPRPSYLEEVLAAAHAAGLSERYCGEIAAWMPQAGAIRSAQAPAPVQVEVQPRWATPHARRDEPKTY